MRTEIVINKYFDKCAAINFEEVFVKMANRFILNETSYHGAGAIKEIATES